MPVLNFEKPVEMFFPYEKVFNHEILNNDQLYYKGSFQFYRKFDKTFYKYDIFYDYTFDIYYGIFGDTLDKFISFSVIDMLRYKKDVYHNFNQFARIFFNLIN